MKIEANQIIITSLEFNQEHGVINPRNLVTLTANVGDLQNPISIQNYPIGNPENVAVLIAQFEARLPVTEINL